MNPRYALIAILPVLLHLHLSVAVAGATVTVAMSWLVPALLIAAIALGVAVVCWVAWRTRGFSPLVSRTAT